MDYKACAELLLGNDNYLLVTHTRPDGDTLGGAAALCSALRRLGKTAYVLDNAEATPKYRCYVEKFMTSGFEYDKVIAIDVAERRMLCKGFDDMVWLCIDHHPTNPGYAENNVVRGEKASCGEIVFEIIKALGEGITPEEASLLYMAVSTDCGCFKYANVTDETFMAASELAAAGADVQGLNFALFRQVSRARIVLEGEMCAGLRFYRDGKIVVATVTMNMMERCGATENDCDDIAAIPGKVEGCVLSMVIRELAPGKCKVSLRSHPTFDCSAVAAVFDGGGHKMASGCTIMANPDETEKLMLKAVDEVWK